MQFQKPQESSYDDIHLQCRTSQMHIVRDSCLTRQTDRQPIFLSAPFPVSGGDKNKQLTSLPAEDNHTGTGWELPEVLSWP